MKLRHTKLTSTSSRKAMYRPAFFLHIPESKRSSYPNSHFPVSTAWERRKSASQLFSLVLSLSLPIYCPSWLFSGNVSRLLFLPLDRIRVCEGIYICVRVRVRVRVYVCFRELSVFLNGGC